MEFHDTVKAKTREKNIYKHTRTLPRDEYYRLIKLVNNYKDILNGNKGCEKTFFNRCTEMGASMPDSFSFFDFCLLMATIARDEIIASNGNARDDLEMIELMGWHMLPYKKASKLH